MNKLLLVCAMLCMSENVLSASITSVIRSGATDANGYHTVKIVGVGLGTGPNIVLFDDFSKQSVGQKVSLSGPLLGLWSPSSSYSSVPLVVSVNGDNAMSIHDFSVDQNTTSKIRQLESIFPKKVSSIFIGYSVRVPTGRFFSGSTTDAPNAIFPTSSSWKFTWIADGPMAISSQTSFNVCVPTHAGNGSFMLGGNSHGYGWVDIAKTWNTHHKNYFSFGIKPTHYLVDENIISTQKAFSPTDPTIIDPILNTTFKNVYGTLYFQHTGSPAPTTTTTMALRQDSVLSTDPSIAKNGATIFPVGKTVSFDRVKFPGWFGNGDTSNFDAYYDDIYVATGPNAFARVELSDQESPSKSIKNLAMPVTMWNDTGIEFKLHKDHIDKLANNYIRVYDANNQLIKTQLITCPECSKSPDNN